MNFEALDLDGISLRADNISVLRHITEKVLRPLEGEALDERTRLMEALEDLAKEKADLNKKLKLVEFREQALWLKVDRINEARVK